MPDKVPHFNAPIYLQNKSVIGKVDEILGPINEVYFSVKMGEGMVASSFKKGDKVYISGEKLLPIERFLPKPKVAGGVEVVVVVPLGGEEGVDLQVVVSNVGVDGVHPVVEDVEGLVAAASVVEVEEAMAEEEASGVEGQEVEAPLADEAVLAEEGVVAVAVSEDHNLNDFEPF
ncbi:hypothetical protein PHLCEN_2v2649 [Hermanssonia centrifuga]|uniref:H/ACA ribonucleoprotein complex subunit n=1 Tax=Hermanssonia centrifuga TaxID=98765 RepID=A0A2R6RIJ8_9APHY|nr:hypothetical protein PHLCEN_2v2649 [Hermanssonia centrifuga]